MADVHDIKTRSYNMSKSKVRTRSLRENTHSPMSYFNTLKAVLTPEIKAEDEEVAKYPLNITKVQF